MQALVPQLHVEIGANVNLGQQDAQTRGAKHAMEVREQKQQLPHKTDKKREKNRNY